MLFFGLNLSVWEDTIYTLNIVHLSFKEMIFTTAGNVHPPLYYIILKIVFKFIHLFSLSSATYEIIVAKLVSVVPLIFLLCFSLKKLKKDFGWLVAGIFAFCIITIPKMMYYGVEIRMYSWAILFITLSFYYAYMITKHNNKKNWIVFTLFSLMAAYTHYYATIATFFIYLFLLFHIILKNKSRLKGWILSTILTVLLYIPWILTFYQKTSYLTSPQWNNLNSQSIPKLIPFIFSPINGYVDTPLLNGLGVLLVLSLVILIYISIKWKKNRDSFISLGGIFVLIAPLSFGLIFSILIKPMFYTRYAVPMLGCLWLSFSILLSKFYSKKQIFIPILVVVLLIGMVNTITFIDSENNDKLADSDFKNYLNNINNNDIVIYVGPPWLPGYIFNFYLKEKKVITWDNNSSIIPIIEKGLKNNKIWVFDSDQTKYGSIIDLNKTLVENDLKLEEVGKIKPSLEYPHYIYLVSS
jgi:hypothetical protein